MGEHLHDAAQGAILHWVHIRISTVPLNQDEIIFLSVQCDWVECKVAVDKEDVIPVYFEGHFSVGATLGSAPSTVSDHDHNFMIHGRVPKIL